MQSDIAANQTPAETLTAIADAWQLIQFIHEPYYRAARLERNQQTGETRRIQERNTDIKWS